MSKMRVVQVSRPKEPLEVVEREIPEPGVGAVRIKVEACGICHGDVITTEGYAPIQYPRVPGHEVAGAIDAIGPDVVGWKVGQRIGVGWHGGHCGHCADCRRGDFLVCSVAPQVPGITYDGGYAEYMVAPAAVLARLPEGLSATEAAPLMCAGLTTYNSLRNSGARAGDVVAILGIGGLGHLGVQFAAKMGFVTVAIARGKEKDQLAKKLGAMHYIDSESQDPATELSKLGGAKIILSTVTSGKAMSAVLGGLAANGKLIVLGAAPDPIEAPPFLLISGRRSITGWPSGTAVDSQDVLAFSVLAGVRSINEVFPLERVAEAYERMISGKARFRVVLAPQRQP